MRACLPVCMAVLTTLAACESSPTATADSSRLSAEISGSVTAVYEGNGNFIIAADPRTGEPMTFAVHSLGRGEARDQGFLLHRRGGGIPARGSYPLGVLDFSEGRPRGFTAAYSRRVGNRVEVFQARSGEVEITASSTERVEGRFRFTAAAVCQAPAGSSGSQANCRRTLSPATDPGTPTVEVSGSFVAVPGPARMGVVSRP